MARASAKQVEALEARVDTLEKTGRYDEAIEVLAELEQLTGDDQRWHVAWMHVLAGRRAEADAIWAALEREHPADPTVPFLAGSAHAEADEPAVAAELFAQALELALRGAADGETLRQIVTERTRALTDAGLAPGAIDESARLALARAAAQGVDTPVATPYFSAIEFALAVEAWPGFAEDWRDDGHAGYALELDRRMRAIAPNAPRRPVVVPLTVEMVRERAAAEGLDEEAAEARARVAYEIAQEGGAIPWPPGRNEPCWCGSGKKYKKCCGR
ncbi:MAG TPA: SEC-C metal-binding domain-containing protein [Baekduia sp.]|uniref:SEC-C metal-binding domain-containing protein n=1 Tax=Baekduia sp. TaxID=2600305 RepID=UPI002D0560B1|nr:SEC-C metal-binding domain-containing protein [Baekduia sp.]HMJ32396.1 SEC-C metal-binding domain-containing protein [Baekduia sp.]